MVERAAMGDERDPRLHVVLVGVETGSLTPHFEKRRVRDRGGIARVLHEPRGDAVEDRSEFVVQPGERGVVALGHEGDETAQAFVAGS